MELIVFFYLMVIPINSSLRALIYVAEVIFLTEGKKEVSSCKRFTLIVYFRVKFGNLRFLDWLVSMAIKVLG